MVESVPDNLQDIRFSLLSIDMLSLNEIEGILKTAYPKSEWNEEFVTEYKVHQHFIETGLDHDNSDKICPFCKRTYNSEALINTGKTKSLKLYISFDAYSSPLNR